MKLDDLIARVRAAVGDGSPGSEITVQVAVTNAVRATVRELGLGVAGDGEIISPAPAPRPAWELPAQQNVRYRGQRRRR